MPFRSSGRSRQIDAAARIAGYKAEQVRLKEAAAERRAAAAARLKADDVPRDGDRS